VGASFPAMLQPMQQGDTSGFATDDAVTTREQQRPEAPRVVAMTMVRDESDMLPRWIDYYGRQLGVQNLLVLDDNSVDGSTDDLPCMLYRLPPEPWKRRWAPTRARLANGLARGLLACNDVVIFTDADEFLVPDPDKYSGLLDYLAHRSEVPVIAPLAFEVMHNARVEPAFDPARPLLEQRRFVKFAPAMCKPLLKRVSAAWEPAFHAIHAPFEVDPELFMLHLKYYDETALSRVAEHRYRIRESEGRGSPRSFWSKSPDKLMSLLSTWTSPDHEDGTVEVLDVGQLNYRNLISEKSDGTWRSDANQVTGLSKYPLRELPERFRGAF
jgi:Glycosyl transferase family 2